MSSYAEYKRTFGRKKGGRDASGTYHSPVSSASGDSQDEGFLKIEENTMHVKWVRIIKRLLLAQTKARIHEMLTCSTSFAGWRPN